MSYLRDDNPLDHLDPRPRSNADLIAAARLLDALGIPADAGEEPIRIAAQALNDYAASEATRRNREANA
jgi:hypothetical protein